MIISNASIVELISYLEEKAHCQICYLDTTFRRVCFSRSVDENSGFYEKYSGFFSKHRENEKKHGSLAGAMISPAMATWFSTYVTGPWNLPGVVANVTTMAITGMFICMVCRAAPWVEKKPVKACPPVKSSGGDGGNDGDSCGGEGAEGNGLSDDVHSPSWLVRRVLADFTEAPFYGNEVASVFLLIGLVVGEIVSGTHGAYGSGAVSAIVLSQFVGATVGVFLYADKFDNGGWYATYVPVVSVGPACVLMFGANIPVALFAGIVGGIFGGPVAEFFAGKLPEGVHVTVANVTSMAICTLSTVAVMQVLPWF